VTRDLRHNLVALGADHGLFIVGLSFVSTATILPAFASSLGAPSALIGAIPAVMTLGWFLPSLFTAGHIETLPRKLPFVLRWTLLERVPWVALAAAVYFLAFYPSVMREEADFLAKKFGEEFAGWAAAVPLFLPRLAPAGPRSSRFDWARVRQNREWRTAIAVPAMAGLLFARWALAPS